MPSVAQKIGFGTSGPAFHGRAFGRARGNAPQARGLTLRRQAD